MKNWIIRRLIEPSTWAGLSVVVPVIATGLCTGFTPAIIGQLAAGMAAVVIGERGNEQ